MNLSAQSQVYFSSTSSSTISCAVKSFSCFSTGGCGVTSPFVSVDFGDGTPFFQFASLGTTTISSMFTHNYPLGSTDYTATVGVFTSSLSSTPCLTASCIVSVCPPCPIVTSISQQLGVNGTVTLTALENGTINPSYAYWDLGFGATILSGNNPIIVQYNLDGIRNISAYYYDSNYNGSCFPQSFSSSVNITNSANCINVSGINILTGSNGTATLTATNNGTLNPTYVIWSIPTCTIISGNNPCEIIYPANGIFTVCATFSNSCSQSYCTSIYAPPYCNANFTYITSLNSGIFTSIDVGYGAVYNWSIYNNYGFMTYDTTTQINFQNPGTYTVGLTIYPSYNSTIPCGSSIQTITVGTATNCVAAFSYTNSNCYGVLFNNYSLGGLGYSYKWDFGDGNINNTSTSYFHHQYTANGTYIINLGIYSPFDSINPCSSVQQTILVNCPTLNCQASANFNVFADSLNAGQYFAYNTSSGNGVLSYLWNFGDGATSTQQYPFHQYAIPSQYVVCLQVTSTIGTTTCTNYYCDSSSVHRIASGFQMSSINVIPQKSTGINNITISNSLIVYPNPFSDEIIIDVDMNNFSFLIRYQLHDALGKIISENEIKSSKTIINTASLEQGFYFISIKNDVENILKTIKLVK